MPAIPLESGERISTIHTSTKPRTHATAFGSLRFSRLSHKFEVKLRRKSYRSRLLRLGLLVTNIAIMLIVVLFVFHSSQTSASVSLNPSAISAVANPLDQLSSADIALTVAQMANLPESTAITNQADTQAAELAMSATSNNVVSKPQVIATALKSRANITNYVAKSGDTIATIATQFGISSNSILWSNGLTSNTVTAGQKLIIPPITGIVYTVKSGDTAQSLAQKFSANQAQIIAYNDAEISGLQAGEQILIPNGTQPATVYAASASIASSSSFPWGGDAPVYGSNGYDYGYCTWFVATQVAVPNNWGNASSWAYYAALSGWNVSSTPTVGAIAQTPYAAGGEGHVALVTGVSADGSQIKYEDMNGLAGWGRIGYSGWVSASTFPNYITH
jgi:surface antigen